MRKVNEKEKDYRYFHQYNLVEVDGKRKEPTRVTYDSIILWVNEIARYEIKRDGKLKFLNPEFHHEFDESGLSDKLYNLSEHVWHNSKIMGVTIAFDRDTGEWNYSICVYPDQFSKRKGRWIAGGRLAKHGSAIKA